MSFFFLTELFLESLKNDTLSKYILKQMRIEDSITFPLLIFHTSQIS